MDKSTAFNLIKTTYEVDAIGQRVPVETVRKVFGRKSSATRAEWSAAGVNGIKASFVLTMFAPEYRGEEVAELGGKRYAIYRTFLSKTETVELYLGEEVGVHGN